MVEDRGVLRFDEGFLHDQAQHRDLFEALRNDFDCVVVEIEYCVPASLNSIVEEVKREVPGVTIRYEYFEADLDKANQNCRRRKNKRDPEAHIGINTHRIGSRYTIPAGVQPRDIYVLPEESPL